MTNIVKATVVMPKDLYERFIAVCTTSTGINTQFADPMLESDGTVTLNILATKPAVNAIKTTVPVLAVKELNADDTSFGIKLKQFGYIENGGRLRNETLRWLRDVGYREYCDPLGHVNLNKCKRPVDCMERFGGGIQAGYAKWAYWVAKDALVGAGMDSGFMFPGVSGYTGKDSDFDVGEKLNRAND